MAGVKIAWTPTKGRTGDGSAHPVLLLDRLVDHLDQVGPLANRGGVFRKTVCGRTWRFADAAGVVTSQMSRCTSRANRRSIGRAGWERSVLVEMGFLAPPVIDGELKALARTAAVTGLRSTCINLDFL